MAETVDLRNNASSRGIAVDRVSKFDMRWNMYNDNYKDQVIRKLREIYSKADVIGMDKQIDLTNNIYKTIVDKISRVYSFGIDRGFEDDALTSLYKKARVNKYMKQANKYVNAFNDVVLQVSWDEVKEIPRFNFRLPHRTKVVLDENDSIVEIEYFIEHVKDKGEKWAYWSASEHYYKYYKNNTSSQEAVAGNEKMINPYGVLPFVVMQKGFRDGYFFDEFSGDDLINITIDNAIYNTFKNYLIKWQSFKQLVVTGTNIGQIAGQMLDPSTALTVNGTETNVDLLDLQANLEQLVNTLETASNTVAINYNISPNQFRLTGQVSSGFALQMENKALDEFTAEQQSDFIHYEKELLSIIVKIGSAHGVKMVEEQDVDISFGDIRYSESITETLNAYSKSIELALSNPVEIIANERDITEEEAEKIYLENINQRNKLNDKLNRPELNAGTTAEALGLNA